MRRSLIVTLWTLVAHSVAAAPTPRVSPELTMPDADPADARAAARLRNLLVARACPSVTVSGPSLAPLIPSVTFNPDGPARLRRPPSRLSPSNVTLSGTVPTIATWAGPNNIYSQNCCPEGDPKNRLDLRMVAVGQQGMLVTMGSFDDKPIQVGGNLFGSWYCRFYVNGAP